VSMDGSGKVIWARHSEILTTVIKGGDKTLKDGEAITLAVKDLGSTELYPQTLLHSPNGRFVAVCGDGEYIIYTALILRNQAFGAALDFAWASKENDKDYAIRESQYSVKIFRNFKPKGGDGTVNIGFTAEGLSGGNLLGVKGQGGIGFFDWETGKLVSYAESKLSPRVSSDQSLVNLFVWPARRLSTCCDTRESNTLRLFKPVHYSRMVPRRLSKSCARSTRGMFGSRWELTSRALLTRKQRPNWLMGWRLLCLHERPQSPQLHCRRSSLHHLPLRSTYIRARIPA